MAVNSPSDNITIQSITPDTKQMLIQLNIEGNVYNKVLPFFSDQDPDLLTAQLQAFAVELRSEFDALTAAIKAADAGTTPPVSAAVTSLVGTAIPVDTAPVVPPVTP